MVRAVLSVGTNSTRALVARVHEGRPHTLFARSIGTRIGEGLRESGLLSDEAMARTLGALGELAGAVDSFGATPSAIGTSALRRAHNAEFFVSRVREVVGCDLQIVDGEEEARLSFAGAAAVMDEPASLGVADIGGGSTEYAVGARHTVQRAVSCEIGAVRLTERGDTTRDVARARVKAALVPIAALPHARHLVLVGGSANTAVALLRGKQEPFERYAVTRDVLLALETKLRALTVAQRTALPGMNPQRADIMPAGLLIAQTLLELTEHDRATVCTGDLLLGYLLR